MMIDGFTKTIPASVFSHFPDYAYRKAEKPADTLPVATFMDAHRDCEKDVPFVYTLARFAPDQIRGHFDMRGPDLKTSSWVDIMVDVFYDDSKWQYRLTAFILPNQYTKATKPHRLGDFHVSANAFESDRESIMSEVVRRVSVRP
jgi:hypothetical protein